MAEKLCNIVTYESFRRGDVLCLVLKCACDYGCFEGYGTFNYDTAKGVRLTNADSLQMEGVTQEQCMDTVRCAAAKCYDDQYFPIWGEYGFNSPTTMPNVTELGVAPFLRDRTGDTSILVQSYG